MHARMRHAQSRRVDDRVVEQQQVEIQGARCVMKIAPPPESCFNREQLIEQARFRAGYDFLLLRVESGEVPAEIGRWWTNFLNADGETRASMLLPQKPDEAKKRRRRKRKPAADKTPAAS